MKITVLIENKAPGAALAHEHGLSLFIEYRGRRYLLDAGSSGAFADNAEKLGVDVSAADAAILSHGHFDHADGLRRFFALNETAKLYCREGADGAFFGLHEDPAGPKFIGIHREILEKYRDRFVFLTGEYSLAPGLRLLPDGVQGGEFAGKASNLMRKTGPDEFVRDDFRHEQSAVFETERGLVICNSCCHSGVCNIVEGVMRALPGRPVRAVVGGLHMMGPAGTSTLNCTPEFIASVCARLLDLGVEEIYTGHCTGDPAFAILKERLGDRVSYLNTGRELNF